MANDRIYLVCNVCHGFRTLYKYHPGGGSVWSESTSLNTLSRFMNLHLHDRLHIQSLDGDPGFFLETEELCNLRMKASPWVNHDLAGWAPEQDWPREYYDEACVSEWS